MKVKELAERHSVTSVILEVRKEIRTEEGEREKRQGNRKEKKVGVRKHLRSHYTGTYKDNVLLLYNTFHFVQFT